jgi:hypothetical protein
MRASIRLAVFDAVPAKPDLQLSARQAEQPQ